MWQFCLRLEPVDVSLAATYPGLTVITHPFKAVTKMKPPSPDAVRSLFDVSRHAAARWPPLPPGNANEAPKDVPCAPTPTPIFAHPPQSALSVTTDGQALQLPHPSVTPKLPHGTGKFVFKFGQDQALSTRRPVSNFSEANLILATPPTYAPTAQDPPTCKRQKIGNGPPSKLTSHMRSMH